MLSCVSTPLALSLCLQCNPCMALMGSSVCQVPAWLCGFIISVSIAIAKTSKRREDGCGSLQQVSVVPAGSWGRANLGLFWCFYYISELRREGWRDGTIEGQMKAGRQPCLGLFPRDA